MSILFTPIKLNQLEIKNRFVHSATCESMAALDGSVTPLLLKRYGKLARGEVGLIIPGFFYVHPYGKTLHKEMGIHDDRLIPGLAELVETVHENGAKIIFQLAHSGAVVFKNVIDRPPLAPSNVGKDPLTRTKPRQMTIPEIKEVIQSFGKAARRAVAAGVDGIQIHGAHGYLIAEFLSSFFNRRKDDWGGSDENRFRFLKEVFLAVRQEMPPGMPLTIKLNCLDDTPKSGITVEMAKKYVAWLVELGIDAVEPSSGNYYGGRTARGDITDDWILLYPRLLRPFLRPMLKRTGFPFKEAYHTDLAKAVRPALGDIPLMLVGGIRSVEIMEKTVETGVAEMISMSRPFIRQPMLVKKIMEKKVDQPSCVSCNKCLLAIFLDLNLKCYKDADMAQEIKKNRSKSAA